jgi:hypothetical protein
VPAQGERGYSHIFTGNLIIDRKAPTSFGIIGHEAIFSSRKTVINFASDHRGDNRAGRLPLMIKHIVMFKFKKFAESNNKLGNTQMLKQYLEALPAKINEIKFFQVGVNFSDATVAYDLVLVSEFFSKESLYSYQQHPEHLKVADFVGKVCESRIIVDYVV